MRVMAALYVVGCVMAGGCSGFDVVNTLARREAGEVRTGIAYGDHQRQRLDVYLPRAGVDGVVRSRGVVVFFYGGSWKSGRREDYAFVGHALASRGYTAIVPDYRVYPEVQFPVFVRDGARVVRWAVEQQEELRWKGGGVFVAGHSAGAHIAGLLLMDRSYIEAEGLKSTGPDRSVLAGALLSGPYDFVPGPDVRMIFESQVGGVDPAYQVIDFARESPVISDDGPAVLLIHGADDSIVGAFHSERLAQRLNQVGTERAELRVYSGRGHVQVALALGWGFRWICPTLDDIDRFFTDKGACKGVNIGRVPDR